MPCLCGGQEFGDVGLDGARRDNRKNGVLTVVLIITNSCKRRRL